MGAVAEQLRAQLLIEKEVVVPKFFSNLDREVSENDVKEIFAKLGKVKKAMLNFDGSGRSRGTGEIIFATKAIAQKAVEEYDRAEVDGRPMYLKLADGGAAAKPKKKEIVVKQAARKTVRKKSTGRVPPVNGAED